ncbi:MAG: M1 family metallopeptidase [Phycisphaerae bacterium]
MGMVIGFLARRSRLRVGLLAGWLMALASAGCSAPALSVRPTLYELDVRLDPQAHTLTGQAQIHLRTQPTQGKLPRRAAIELKLHPALRLDRMDVEGATLLWHLPRTWPGGDDTGVWPTVHQFVVEDPGESIVVSLSYSGELYQDVSAGETPGQIHNFMMAAHVSPEGIYLAEDGYWHPVLSQPGDSDPALGLADFRLAVEPLEGMELVAGAERSVDASGDGKMHWQSGLPVEAMVLLGGPLKRWTRRHGEVTVHAVLSPEKEDVANDILDYIGELLDRYEPLLGPYPYKDFTLLEAFFSSGFAFPTCTQIAGSRLTSGKPYRRHGYIDHEMVHSWWGCGVYVDPRDGNWCEALTSFCTNYYGYVLDGDEAGARKQRRNYSNFLSRIKVENDKPLGTFGLDDGAGRGIAYSKGSAVFGMLEQTVGTEAFFAALRRLTTERAGTYVNWTDIQEAFEAESGQELAWFFDEWVRQGGAPPLALTGADYKPDSDQLAVWLSQGDQAFRLSVPLRLEYGSRSKDVAVDFRQSEDRLTVACESEGLTAVELDPDYRVFRKLKPSAVMPTSSLTRRGKRLTIVTPDGPLAEGYQTLLDEYREAVAGTDDEPEEGAEVKVIHAGEVMPESLDGANVLVLGDAVSCAAVQALLADTQNPVRWTGAGFEIDGQTYRDPGQAVFLTVHHPHRPGGGITVYYGNSPEALANAGVLSFYPNSLLVFEVSVGKDGAGEGFGARVIERIDFESHDRISF